MGIVGLEPKDCVINIINIINRDIKNISFYEIKLE